MRPPLKVMSPVACSRMFVWPAKPENEVIVRSSPKTVDEAAVIKAKEQMIVLPIRFIMLM